MSKQSAFILGIMRSSSRGSPSWARLARARVRVEVLVRVRVRVRVRLRLGVRVKVRSLA